MFFKKKEKEDELVITIPKDAIQYTTTYKCLNCGELITEETNPFFGNALYKFINQDKKFAKYWTCNNSNRVYFHRCEDCSIGNCIEIRHEAYFALEEGDDTDEL